MEGFLQRILAKLTWLNVGDDRLQAEFAAHAGWGLAITLLGNWIAGHVGMLVAGFGWIGYSIYKECIEDGHLLLLLRQGYDPEFKDFYTDLLSRILPVVIVLGIEIWRRS